MVGLSVVAKPYARAAYEFASKNGKLQEWSSLFDVFAKLVNTKTFAEVVSSPSHSQLEIINELKDQLAESFYNFLIVIAENKKLLVIPEIAHQFETMKDNSKNKKIADVTLAYSADKELLENLKESLEKRFDCSIKLNVSVDASIIGGAIVKVGDTVIDDSVSGRLDKMKSVLLS